MCKNAVILAREEPESNVIVIQKSDNGRDDMGYCQIVTQFMTNKLSDVIMDTISVVQQHRKGMSKQFF